jgi:23S rRNA pseudouridine2605 synthase
LQKFLAQAAVASRRNAEELIRSGTVRVNGVAVTTFGTQVDPQRDRVEVEGRRVRADAAMYRLLLKPRACLSTLGKAPSKPGEPARPTLARFVPDAEPHWQLAAPLDFQTEGVVLVTTDGELAQQLAKGGGSLPMTYHVKYQGAVGPPEIARLARGWRVDGRRTLRPTQVKPLATTGKNTWVELVVNESRPRALKASGDPIRRFVLKISRVRLGDLSFEGLEMGGWRDLSRAEVVALRKAAGVGG